MKITTVLLLGASLGATGGATWLGTSTASGGMEGFEHAWDVARVPAPAGDHDVALVVRVACQPGCRIESWVAQLPRGGG